jgi:hypothetical protein
LTGIRVIAIETIFNKWPAPMRDATIDGVSECS